MARPIDKLRVRQIYWIFNITANVNNNIYASCEATFKPIPYIRWTMICGNAYNVAAIASIYSS